ncbi:MAG: non-homologous end-joining DNA ligase [Steroidobacteraceae bacterium]
MPVRKHTLETYRAKRTFSRTPEPAPGETGPRHGPLLFVVQKHAAARLHYDFRLELDGVLKSWAVPKGPSLAVGEKRLAIEVEDHPIDYASFEGVIPPKQYGAGQVIVWDCGVYSPDEGQEYAFRDRDAAQERVRAELANGKLSLFLRGEKLKGSFALVRTSANKQWLLLKHKDQFAAQQDVLVRNRSVLSGATLEDISLPTVPERYDATRLVPHGPAEAYPQKLAPMLAQQGERLRSDPEWLYEPKVDGYRVMAFVRNGAVRLTSRRGLDLTPAFPEVVAALSVPAADTLVLDGEIVALDESGRPSFSALQNRVQLKTTQEIALARRRSPVVLFCFDILHFADVNLRDAPYIDRRRYLSQCLLPGPTVQLVHTAEEAEKLYDAAIASGFEGIVAKRKASPYRPGSRSPAWRKFKAVQTAEFIVGGYTKGKGGREPLGALLLGYRSGKELTYAGHVGSGLTAGTLDMLRRHFAGLTRKTSAFAASPPLHRPTTWLEPERVVEVSFSGWTPDGLLRAPVFARLRDDVAAESVKRASRVSRPSVNARSTPSSELGEILQQLDTESKRMTLSVGEHRIHLTNLDREYWPAEKRLGQPAITKRDLIRYLAGVSGFMLPHLKDRPLTMIRMPGGIQGERFFQKHWEQPLPEFVERIRVFSGHQDESHDYILANNLPTILWLGQSGTLEFHVWHSRASVAADCVSSGTGFGDSLQALERSVLNYPDYLVFDIDPYIYSGREAKGAEPELNEKGFEGGRRVAFWLQALLRQMSLQPIVKTSGKTGLHVFVPVERVVTFDVARQICEMVGRHVMREHPKVITMEWAVEKRTGKIFIDYGMNVRGKTLNVAYSPRGVPGAPVSMPISWQQLESARPMDFTVSNVLGRLEKSGDRWHDVLSEKQSLAQAFGSIART